MRSCFYFSRHFNPLTSSFLANTVARELIWHKTPELAVLTVFGHENKRIKINKLDLGMPIALGNKQRFGI
jgi:hypothetical protein